MEIMLTVAVVYSLYMACWSHWVAYKNGCAAVPPTDSGTEEDINTILAKIRQDRKNRRAKEISNWEAMYFQSLPVEEHPDYFELDLASDDVDRFTIKNGYGEVYAPIVCRKNYKGVQYDLRIDYVTQTAHVTTGKISWEVPLSKVDNWKHYV